LFVLIIPLALVIANRASGHAEQTQRLFQLTQTPIPGASAATNAVYFPYVVKPGIILPTPTATPKATPTRTPIPPTPPPTGNSPLIHVPYFNGDILFGETAIFWFGKVHPTENYSDVRIGYNNTELYVRVAILDRLLWYDPSPTPQDFTAWDAATLLINLDGNTGNTPGSGAYRFVGQLNWWEQDQNFQAGYQGNNSGWVQIPIAFTTKSGWRGNAPLDMENDDGWILTYKIPFTSLGLSGPPSPGTIWGIGILVHDRDDAAGTPIADKSWPSNLNLLQPSTWNRISFGLATYPVPPVTPVQTVTIRHGLNGANVQDGEVGGGSLCGDGLHKWTQWGETSDPGSVANADFNVQNQEDIADFPCFSKYYVIFPLESIPSGKVIISATLTLHEFGNAGGGAWGTPPPSLIQVLTYNGNWLESTLTWNNAPLAQENFSRTRVDPITVFPGWPGVPYNWDVSQALAQAYEAGQPLRLVLYSADQPRHTGKYFVSSDAADWNAAARPTLRVTWGNP
jgi:hypothetical protein